MFTSVVDSFIGLDSSCLCHKVFIPLQEEYAFLPLQFEISHVTSLVNRMLENMREARAYSILVHLNICSGTSTTTVQKTCTAGLMLQER